MYWKQWVDNLIKIARSTDIPESPDQLPPYAKVTPQLKMGPRWKRPPLGLCKSCTHGKRTTKDTRRKQPTMCILWKTTRANRCSSIARRTGSKHEASPICCWLKVSHEPTAKHTQRMTPMTTFIAAQQLANAVHVSVLCTHHTAESPSAGCSLATALGHTFFPK